MNAADLERALRHYTDLLEQAEAHAEREYERDSAEFFAAEQMPADSNFR